MGNEVQTTSRKSEVIKSVSSKLTSLLSKHVKALPENFNETRFIQNCLTVLNDTDGIEKCNYLSIARTLVKGAYLGLDFLNKECYAIPYGGQCQFQTDYKGEIKLAKRWSSSPIRDFYAKVVREGDVLEIPITDGIQTVNFNPKPFNNGEIIGAFAVVYFEDGSMLCDAMSREEIEEVRDKFSKKNKEGQFSKAWRFSFGEMCKKTVVHRVRKYISLDFDYSFKARFHKEGSDLDLNSGKETPKVENPFDQNGKETPIDVSAEVREDVTDAEFKEQDDDVLTAWEEENLDEEERKQKEVK